MRHEACGGAIFKLTQLNVTAIEHQGLNFFQMARQGRGYPEGDRLHSFYSYEPWQQTPLPAAWASEGTWLGLACMRLGFGLTRSITNAAREPGSYFTLKRSGAMLLVIPRLKLAVYTYTQ
jgi:hypothetical protein